MSPLWAIRDGTSRYGLICHLPVTGRVRSVTQGIYSKTYNLINICKNNFFWVLLRLHLHHMSSNRLRTFNDLTTAIDSPWSIVPGCAIQNDCGQNLAITFQIAPINFVFHTLHTMEPTRRCQLCDLESGRHRVCVNEPHRYKISTHWHHRHSAST